MNPTLKVRSLFISDCHLGFSHSSYEKLMTLIKNVECEYLYIVGDFIDGWALKRNFKWRSENNVIFQKILRLNRKGTKVFYVWGNHDDFLEHFDGDSLGKNIEIVRETHHVTLKGEKLLILHGDKFDGLISKNKWISVFGSILYDYSISLNKITRFFEFSLSKYLKVKSKEATKYITSYEKCLSDYCKSTNCDSVVCGHIHVPEIKKMNDIMYYNCGDWIENDTFIVENSNGELELIYFDQFFENFIDIE